MEIIDINGKLRTVKDNIKVITHTRENRSGQVFHENIDGELVAKKKMVEVEVKEKWVEVIILGKSREWVEWYPLKIFEVLNPEIVLNF